MAFKSLTATAHDFFGLCAENTLSPKERPYESERISVYFATKESRQAKNGGLDHIAHR